MKNADVVIDCSDNFATRQAVNAACVSHGKPLVSGAAVQFDGQISVYDTRDAASPCYACIFPPEATLQDAACATMGVFAPLVGIVGSMQAAEALKLLTGIGHSLAGRLQMLDARTMDWSEIRLSRAAHCSVCARPRTDYVETGGLQCLRDQSCIICRGLECVRLIGCIANNKRDTLFRLLSIGLGCKRKGSHEKQLKEKAHS